MRELGGYLAVRCTVDLVFGGGLGREETREAVGVLALRWAVGGLMVRIDLRRRERQLGAKRC